MVVIDIQETRLTNKSAGFFRFHGHKIISFDGLAPFAGKDGITLFQSGGGQAVHQDLGAAGLERQGVMRQQGRHPQGRNAGQHTELGLQFRPQTRFFVDGPGQFFGHFVAQAITDEDKHTGTGILPQERRRKCPVKIILERYFRQTPCRQQALATA